MQILFIAAILSFCALVWAGVSIARHIHANQESGEVLQPKHDFMQQVSESTSPQAQLPILARGGDNQDHSSDNAMLSTRY